MRTLWTNLLLLLAASLLPFAQGQADYGYGCREADLPNEVRRDCHPEPGASEEACRRRGCVWCDKAETFPGFPSCYNLEPNYEPPGLACDAGFVDPLERVDCTSGDEPMDEVNCRYRNCTWCPSLPNAGIPWCFHSAAPDNTGYSMVGQPVHTPDGVTLTLAKSFPNRQPFWEGEAGQLTFEAQFQSDYRLRIKITDGTPRWEVPLTIDPPSGGNANPLYELQFTSSPFSFRVVRKSSGAVLFDSSAGKLTFADQFLSMQWRVPTENVYGVGENEQRTFKHQFGTKLKWPLWAADQPPYHTAALYGTQPHYTVIEGDGQVHAVAIVNSNAQEWQFLGGPSIKYTTIGGLFDLYFFLGPSPDDTVSQYTEAVGRAQMPAYWALGFQLCKYGYNSLQAMKEAVERTAAAGIPQDVQYGDIDIMRDELDFTYAEDRFAGLPQYIQELKGKGIKFVTILDPFISIIEGPTYRPFTLGEEMDVWVKKGDGSPVTGRVWPRAQTAPCYFPDYSKASGREWWITLIREFHDLLAYDGLWIDMNEPANFEHGDLYEGCARNKWNFPPYKPGYSTQNLQEKTLCPDHVDSVGRHYDTHSLYGWFESEPTLAGVREGTGKRGLVLSRSTFLGSGRWSSHWLGDNWSRWSNLHYSIIGVMQFNLWGIPYVGPDICGFIGDTNAALCQRWMELGAFYPFSRNHNGLGYIDQDPGRWPEVAEAARKAYEVRYTLLPFLYTLFYHHVQRGSAVFRPLWYNHVGDSATYPVDKQFMWGSGLLVSPVLTEATTTLVAYFPDNRHYDYYTGAEERTRKGTTTLPAPLHTINVHVAGGAILPTQGAALNTEAARENPFGLIVALDDGGRATGDLFYDDGDSIDTHVENGPFFYATFEMEGGSLRSRVVADRWSGMAGKRLDTVRLLGFGPVESVTVNGTAHSSFENKPSGEVTVTQLNLPVNAELHILFA